MTETIRISDPRSIRAIFFLAHGQRVEQWLPCGTYQVGAEVWLDSASGIRARTLTGTHKGNLGTWYVSPNMFAGITTTTK